jgi:hypothetical protein
MHPALLALALLASNGSATEAVADPPPAPIPADHAAPTPAPGPALDFELLEPPAAEAPTPDPAFAQRVEKRRTMLKLHQGLGIATWAALAATTVVGQLQFDDRFRGGGDTGRYRTPHKVLVATSATLFTATGLLGLLAPEPYRKRPAGLDTATLHKVLMGVATAGMVAQVILGVAARGKAGTTQERDLAVAHQVIGYTTFGAMTAGAVVLFF